jgi:serine protease Do
VKVYNQIIKTGKVTRGAIGVGFQEAKSELLKVYGAESGVFVQTVTPGMPADKAGIKPEDVIIAIDGKPVSNGQDLVGTVSDMPVGSTVNVTIIRDKKKQDVKVQIGDRQEIVNGERPGESPEGDTKEDAMPAKFGVSIENLTAARRGEMNLESKSGVLVRDVTPGSFADDIGLVPNDVIVSINRIDVNTVDDVKRIQSTLKPGDAVAFRVMRSAGQGRGAREWVSLFLAGTLKDTQ